MFEDRTLTHDLWQRSYPLLPHSTNQDGTIEYRLVFDDGQKIFFTPERVCWSEVTRTVAMWEGFIDQAKRKPPN